MFWNYTYQIIFLSWFIIRNLHPKNYISVDLQLYIKMPYFSIGILYLENCTSAYSRLNKLGYFALFLKLNI